MSQPQPETITKLLDAAREGDRAAVNELFPLVYDELRAMAQRQRRNWHGDYTINTTALVHEAYLKLVDQSHAAWEGRAHFLSVAAKAMRHILVDYARRRRAEKRGGNVQKLSLEEMKGVLEEEMVLSDERAEALVVLDEALGRLSEVDARAAQVVECRFFGGMTIDETAAVLGVAPRTVTRDWEMAQTWLFLEMEKELHS